MNKYIIRALFSALIFAFLSCSESNSPQVIENSNNERHIFVLEQGQSFDYDIAKDDNNTDPTDTTLKVIRKTSTSIGSKSMISDINANSINDNEFLDFTIFRGASHISSDEEGLQIYMPSLLIGDTVKVMLNDIWLKVVDFDDIEWDILSGVDTVNNQYVHAEIEYRIYGKRITVADILYKKENYDALNIDVTIWTKTNFLDGSSNSRISTKKTNILSVGKIGIFQLKTLTNKESNEFHYSILSDDNL